MAEMLCRPVEVHVIKGNETFKILLAVKPKRRRRKRKKSHEWRLHSDPWSDNKVTFILNITGSFNAAFHASFSEFRRSSLTASAPMSTQRQPGHSTKRPLSLKRSASVEA